MWTASYHLDNHHPFTLTIRVFDAEGGQGRLGFHLILSRVSSAVQERPAEHSAEVMRVPATQRDEIVAGLELVF